MKIPEVDETEAPYDFYPYDKEKLLALGDKYLQLVIHDEQRGKEGDEIERAFQKVTWCGVVATKLSLAEDSGKAMLYGFEHRLIEEARLESARVEEQVAMVIPLPRPTSDLLPA